MKLATRTDVAARLADGLDDDTDVEDLLDEASVMVQEYLRRDYVEDDDVPKAVTIVVSRMVARRVSANADNADGVPDGVSSLMATDFQASFAEPFVSVGVWLNRTDKLMLRRYRVSVVSIPLTSDRGRSRPSDCDDD